MTKTNKKLVIAVIALAVALACTFGVVAAWLADQGQITNVFTVGNVNITLTETGATEGGSKTYNRIKPGDVLAKDAEITVEKTSEDCWVYVKVEAINNTVDLDGAGGNDPKEIIQYAVTGWTELTGVAGVYYREAAYNETDDQTFTVFQTDVTNTKGYVTVNSTLTSAEFDAISVAAGAGNDVKLVITGYAVQKTAGETAKDAWTAAGFN